MTSLIVAISIFVGVSALVGGLILFFRGSGDSAVEDRLDLLAGMQNGGGRDLKQKSSLLSDSLDEGKTIYEKIVTTFSGLGALFEQADAPMTPPQFVLITAALGVGSSAMVVAAGLNPLLIPVVGISVATLPFFYLIFRRKMRMKKFASQLPDALELIARALRAGHSLQAGFDLVAKEMIDPIGREFGRVFEEQNLGIAMEDALRNMCVRIPNLDLKFFVTAIILQRQTGGDLAEILDKIGHLIRERYQIWGQVQALTGEGRLSGVVLLGLPPVLFITVYRMNPDYMMILFSDDLGKQMLIGAVILQFVGAFVIRKIVNIKV